MEPIVPMEPKSGETIPAGDGWVAQIKWDGVRVLTYRDGKEVRLFNRKKHERTRHYPEMADAASYLRADSAILDGEVIALGDDGKPSFHEVMRRDGLRRLDKVPEAQKRVPITYMIFDVLYCNGRWLTELPFCERAELLAQIVEPNDHIQLVPSHADGRALFQVIQAHGMEGIVCKRTDSLYAIGEKKDTWLKIKHYRDLIAVIGGFTLNGGVVNAVLLGLYDAQGQLWYIGHTGTGRLTREEWRALTEQLRPAVRPDRPFVNMPKRSVGAYWVEPVLTVKLKYAEWTGDRSLRQPSIEGFVDVPPTQCVFSADMRR